LSHQNRSRPTPATDTTSNDRERIELERLKLTVDIWKKTVEVQQHFNDLELRIRNFALTLLVGILGGTAFAIQQGFYVPAGPYRVSLATLLLLVGFVSWLGFYVLDRHWYHRLLVGSVEHGQRVEAAFANTLPELGLAHAISQASHIELKGWPTRVGYHIVAAVVVFAAVAGPLGLLRPDLISARSLNAVAAGALVAILLARPLMLRDWKIRARHRIDLFYGSVGIMLLILAWAANGAVKGGVPP
jgi:hypothetical protein